MNRLLHPGNFWMHCKSNVQPSHKTCTSSHPDLPEKTQELIHNKGMTPKIQMGHSTSAETENLKNETTVHHLSSFIIRCECMWKFGYSLHVNTTVLWRVFPHQIRDVLFRSGNVKEHLVVNPHLQTQVVAGRIYLVGLEANDKNRRVNRRNVKWAILRSSFQNKR